jgi:ankyrin repeat protein
MFAAQFGYVDIVRFLVEEHGADVKLASSIGGTALMLAAQFGHVEVVRCLQVPVPTRLTMTVARP